ncbi:hypothetical protein Tco_1362382 [Tanacetum coccineum]
MTGDRSLLKNFIEKFMGTVRFGNDNFAAITGYDSPSTSSIIIDEHEAPPIVTTFDEQTSPISLTEADEFNQEDSANFDGNSQFVPYNPPNSEVCMYALTVSTIEPKNIKEAMADHSLIESMQDELNQFRDFKFGNSFHDQKERILLLSNGSGRIIPEI